MLQSVHSSNPRWAPVSSTGVTTYSRLTLGILTLEKKQVNAQPCLGHAFVVKYICIYIYTHLSLYIYIYTHLFLSLSLYIYVYSIGLIFEILFCV